MFVNAMKRRKYLLQEIELLSKEDYISILRSMDVKSGLAKILNKKVGSYLYGYIEEKREIDIESLSKVLEIYYVDKLNALTLYYNRYTDIAEKIIDTYNVYAYLVCQRYGKSPCSLYFGSGIYSAWLEEGVEGLNKAIESKKEFFLLLNLLKEKRKLDLFTLNFSIKPIWEMISVHSSFPVRRVLGLMFDFLMLRLGWVYEGFEDYMVTSYIRKDIILSSIRGFREERSDLIQSLDYVMEGFSALYFDLKKIASSVTALDSSFLIYLSSLTSDLIGDLNEINLKKYLLILRECFLMKLILYALQSKIDTTDLLNILTRRL